MSSTPAHSLKNEESSLAKYLKNTRGFIWLSTFVACCFVARAVVSREFLARILEHSLLACIWDLAWAFAFVLSLYVWKYDCAMSAELRDKTHVVWQRFTSVGVVTACFVLLTPLDWPHLGFPSSIAQSVLGSLVGLVIVVVLYLGPLVYHVLDPEAEILTLPPLTVLSFRNIIYASVAEEIAFRSCMIPIMLRAGFSSNAAVFLTPIFFGLAHVHHIMNDNGEIISVKLGATRIAIKKIYIQAVVQATYTTIFGFISSYLFLRTGTVLAPILAHSFCNYMGLPPTDFLDHPKKIPIAVSYVVGLVGFFALLGPITSLPLFVPINSL